MNDPQMFFVAVAALENVQPQHLIVASAVGVRASHSLEDRPIRDATNPRRTLISNSPPVLNTYFGVTERGTPCVENGIRLLSSHRVYDVT